MSDFGPEVISTKRGEHEAGLPEPGAPFRLGLQLDNGQAGPVAVQVPGGARLSPPTTTQAVPLSSWQWLMSPARRGIKWYPATYQQPRGCLGLYLESCAAYTQSHPHSPCSACVWATWQLKPASGEGQLEKNQEVNSNFVHLFSFLDLEQSQELPQSVLQGPFAESGFLGGRGAQRPPQLPWRGGSLKGQDPSPQMLPWELFTSEARGGLPEPWRW